MPLFTASPNGLPRAAQAVPSLANATSVPGSLIEVSAVALDDAAHDLAVYLGVGGEMARADGTARLAVGKLAEPPVAGLWAGAAPGTEQVYRELGELPDWGTLIVAGASVPRRASRSRNDDFQSPPGGRSGVFEK